jgi:hypothetical protein
MGNSKASSQLVEGKGTVTVTLRVRKYCNNYCPAESTEGWEMGIEIAIRVVHIFGCTAALFA